MHFLRSSCTLLEESSITITLQTGENFNSCLRFSLKRPIVRTVGVQLLVALLLNFTSIHYRNVIDVIKVLCFCCKRTLELRPTHTYTSLYSVTPTFLWTMTFKLSNTTHRFELRRTYFKCRVHWTYLRLFHYMFFKICVGY